MVEWFNTLVLKTKKVNSFQGSNPCLSKKILISILSIEKENFKKIIIKLIITNLYYFHIDLMNYSYVNNNSFCDNQIFFLLYYFKKFLSIKLEIHIMNKFFKIKNEIKKIFHLENIFLGKNFTIGYNFCWFNIFFLKKKLLIMSVIPGFGNQKFKKKTKYIFLKKTNIDGGINKKIYKIIKKYFNKIIIGSNIIKCKNLNSFFFYNFIINCYFN